MLLALPVFAWEPLGVMLSVTVDDAEDVGVTVMVIDIEELPVRLAVPV